MRKTHTIFRHVIGLFSVALLLLSSCKEDEITDIPDQPQQDRPTLTVLGKKLANPYSVKNMIRAYENIREKNPGGRTKELNIEATHLYVRFLPSDYSLYDTLMSDSTLHLLDRPIDYEVAVQGDYYHDPAVPDTLPTYQYTAVPVGYIAPPGVTFETIEELYLPKEDSTLTDAGGRISSEYEKLVEQLEYEALSITGNLPENSSSGRTEGLLPSKWWPAGRITVWDNRLNQFIGISGARVEARVWFEVNTGLTDANGNYRMDDWFRLEANYSIPWERPDFHIRNGSLFQAFFNGPKMKGDWNLNIQRNGMSWVYANVFRAAVRYHYGNIGGLKRPGIFGDIKYSVFDANNNDANGDNLGNWNIVNYGLAPNIRIWKSVNNREKDADELFSTTIHETAHSSHGSAMRGVNAINFQSVDNLIVESWAVAVQWQITAMEYRERGISNYADPFYTDTNIQRLKNSYQYWNPTMSQAYPYTSLFIDLVDNYNQSGINYSTSGKTTTGIIDNVSGYSIGIIESQFLWQVYGIHTLRAQLKANKPAGVTDAQIDQLLNQF